jgi:hypothetical protein
MELGGVLHDLGEDDVDWDAWRPLFEHGHSAEAAFESGFSRYRLSCLPGSSFELEDPPRL